MTTPPALFPETVAISQPTELEVTDGLQDIAKKQLPYLNGLLYACHMSLASLTSHRGLGHVIDNSLKVMAAQRTLLGVVNNGPRVIISSQPAISYIPD